MHKISINQTLNAELVLISRPGQNNKKLLVQKQKIHQTRLKKTKNFQKKIKFKNEYFQVKTKPDVIEPTIRKDCPLDRDQLGSSTWSFLHTIAAVYPERPSAKESSDVKQFFSFFSKVYPCDYCAKDFQQE